MRLTKLGHACVRIEREGVTVVIDPGLFTEADATEGADAILITHEHMDHFAEDRLRAAVERNPGLRIWADSVVAAMLDGIGARVTAVGEGDAFDIDDLSVSVHGEWHAVIHPDVPLVRNVGYLIDGRVFHPGDSWTVPQVPVDTLLLPTSGPWTKLAEQVDYVRELSPRLAVPVHDAVHSEIARPLWARWFGPDGLDTGAEYRQLGIGERLEI